MYIDKSDENKSKYDKIRVICDECSATYNARAGTARRHLLELGHHQCRKCSSRKAGQKTAAKMSAIYSAMYSGDGNFAKKPGVGAKISKKLKGVPFSEEHKQALRKPKSKTDKIKESANRPEEVARRRKRMLENNPMRKKECREKVSESISNLHISGGYQESLKFGYYSGEKTPIPIICRSGLERLFIDRSANCDIIKEIRSAEWRKIPYFLDGKKHFYLPDFELKLSDGSVIIVEVKNSYLSKKESSKLKRIALQEYCHALGIRELTLTEEDVTKWPEQLKL